MGAQEKGQRRIVATITQQNLIEVIDWYERTVKGKFSGDLKAALAAEPEPSGRRLEMRMDAIAGRINPTG